MAQDTWREMTGVDIKVVEYFDYLQGRFGRIFPTQEKIATRVGVSVRTVKRSIAHLKELGVIGVQSWLIRDREGKVRGQRNVYALLGLAGAFIRGLISRITGGPKRARLTRQKKHTFPEIAFEKKPIPPHLLEKIPLLGVWMSRG